jgi:hypothetical protein
MLYLMFVRLAGRVALLARSPPSRGCCPARSKRSGW